MKKFLILIMALSITVAGYAADIKVKRGLDATVPAALPMGEPAMTTDSHRVFFGTGTGKKELLDKAAFDSYTTQNRITLEEADAKYKSKLAFSTYSTNRAAEDLAQDGLIAGKVSAGSLAPVATSGVHNDTTGRSMADAHPTSAITGLDAALAAKRDAAAQAITDAAQDSAIALKATTSSLGTAAYAATGDFATAAQGVKADGAQPALTGAASVEMNASGSGDRSTYIDLHSDATNTDFSSRIIRNSGVNGTLVLQNAGAGTVMVSGPTPKDLTSSQLTIDKTISAGSEYNGVRYGYTSQVTLDSGLGDEPTNWTQYNPYQSRMYLNGEGSLQGYYAYGKITGAAPSPPTDAKDISGIGIVLESDVLNSMTTNEIRVIRGDNSTGVGSGYSVARGLNIQMVKYDADETTNFGWAADGSCNSCGLWVWGGGGAFTTQRSFAGLTVSGKLKYGADFSHLTDADAVLNLDGASTVGDVAIKVSPTQTFTDGTVVKTLSQLAGGGSSNVSDAAYGVGWNGDTTNAPSKNAVYDKIESIASGSGDVAGPASATANAIALFNGTTGKTIKDSAKTIVTSLGADDTTLPTSKAVKDVTDTKAPVNSPTFTGGVTGSSAWGSDLITNGGFASNTTGWAVGLGWSWDATGTAGHTAGSAGTLNQSVSTVVAGTSYKMLFDIKSLTTGFVNAAAGGVVSSAFTTVANDNVFYFTASTAAVAGITASADFAGTVDNIRLYPATSGGLTAGELFTVNAAGSVGIGAPTPTSVAVFEIANPTGPQVKISDGALTNASGGGGIGLYHRNTTGAPASADRLGYFLFGGYDGTAYRNTGLVAAYAESAWTAGSSYPTYLRFETTPSGATSRTERMRITAVGNVQIGSATATAGAEKLQVTGNVSITGTINNPALVGTTSTTIDTLANGYANIAGASATVTNVVAGRVFTIKFTPPAGGTISIATLTCTWEGPAPVAIEAGKSTRIVGLGTGANAAACSVAKENF